MADSDFLIPAGPHRVEIVVQRSRFLATLAHAASAADARVFIASIRDEFPDATHNCWAYVAGPPGDTAAIGMSDAGEPHGTAGRPMLDVLLHSGIGEVAAVVTRYYGGTNLGKGGLVKAYGGAVQHALEALPTVRRVLRIGMVIEVGYADIELVRRSLQEFDADVVRETYEGTVTYHVAVPVTSADRLAASITDRTAGRAGVTRSD